MAYLAVLGERAAIRWLLEQQRIAFPATPRAEVADLSQGDRLLLYATRGAWHNPGRDRGRVIGSAVVTSAVRLLDEPVEIAWMRFRSGCDLDIDGVVRYPDGLELRPLVDRLDAFPKPHAWSIYLRRPLLRLSESDYELLTGALRPMLAARESVLPSYPSVSMNTAADLIR